MMKRILTLLLVVLSAGIWAQSNVGRLTGQVKNKETGEPLFQVQIKVMNGETVVYAGLTDFDGKYNFAPIDPGTYDIVVVEGLENGGMRLTGQVIKPSGATVLNISAPPASAQELGEVVIKVQRELIDKGNPTVIETFESEQVTSLATRDIGSVAALAPGVTQNEDGSFNARGTRSEGNQVFIDGVKVRGSANIPQQAIQSVEIITGGLGAQYGDALGAVTNLTTKGNFTEYFGTVELLSSYMLDNQNYNLLGLTAGGPLVKNEGKTIASFLLSGEFEYQEEPRPYIISPVRVSESKLAQIEATPLRPSTVGQGVLNEGNFLRASDFTEIDNRLNVDQTTVRATGSINFALSKTMNLTVGGRLTYFRGKNGSFASSLMNWSSNSESINSDYSGFVRFRQSFPGTDSSLVSNVFYSIQVDYTRNNRKTWDAVHQDNFFRYGHIGNFTTYQQRFYTYTEDETTGITAWVQQLFQDTAVLFDPSEYNEIRANYTSSYYDFVEDGSITNNTFNLTNIRQGGGLINGDNPESIYGLFQAVGTQQAGYGTTRNSQFRVTAQTTFDIKGHSLIAGLEFEQRIDRNYNLNANGLWTQMRLLQNQAILQLDLDNPILVYDENGVFQDTIMYNRAYDANVPRTFDRNVREKLGLNPNGTDFVDIDSYDPDFFSLDMFSASELVNVGGTQYVGYYGYDYLGNIQTGNPTLNDFFTATDDNGNLTRPVAAFQPLYIAGYIQDQFKYNDIYFNVGVRVDRYDANQSVLKDPYSLYPAYSAGDVRTMALGSEIPGSVGDDYVVYVNDVDNPTAITGYRNGDQWYDAQGDQISNPKDIADISGGIAQPYVYGPTDDNGDFVLSTDGFEDYTPQVTFSPRISFQFPINEDAAFFAHYDVLVQRPTPGLGRFNPFDYLLLDNLTSSTIGNPNLKPQRTTDYEIGFEQKVSDDSKIRLSAFYKEQRDLIQIVSVNEAYPITYLTYGNRDFSTTKGFIIGYELRRVKNVRVTANYTLLFADGSGSGPNTGANLARSGQPNLRYILPLDFDTRHQVTLNVDYRYGFGDRYDGPKMWDKNILEGFGVNLLTTANSGNPYTARVRAFELTTAGSNVPLTGQINGSRMPWTFNMNLTVNKVFRMTNTQSFEVYVSVLNLLNTRNVTNVYAYTGAADDDGWLSSPQGQTSIAFRADAQSYADLYNIRVNSPFNYALPRRIRLGVRYNF
ncbi:MAG: TonB-dependent receptor [Bacteroidetes bacterium]|nr:MAG: TonB-dependent receptor [Bacteroidota bacterium]